MNIVKSLWLGGSQTEQSLTAFIPLLGFFFFGEKRCTKKLMRHYMGHGADLNESRQG